MILEDESQRERAAQPRQRRLDRVRRRQAACQFGIDQMRHHFGVGFARKSGARLLQLHPQFAEILDDTVVDHRNALGGVGMGIGLGRLAVGRPAGVADPDMACQRLLAQLVLEIAQLALGAAAIDPAVFERGDARGIVAAIFQPLERIDQLLGNRPASQNSDNAAHAGEYPQIKVKTIATQNASS